MHFVTKFLICCAVAGVAGLSVSVHTANNTESVEVVNETRSAVIIESEPSSEVPEEFVPMPTSSNTVNEVVEPISDVAAGRPAVSTVDEEPSEAEEALAYTEDELYLLSHLIYGEAGSDCISDEHQQLVGAVAMNRVADDRFPDTLYEVIYAKGQYACVKDGNFDLEPSERAIQNAIAVLNGEVECPADLVFQAEFEQGYAVWKTFDTPYSRTYFCLG